MDFLVFSSQLSIRKSCRCSPKAEWVPPLSWLTNITVNTTHKKKATVCRCPSGKQPSCPTKTSSQRATSVGEYGRAAEGRGVLGSNIEGGSTNFSQHVGELPLGLATVRYKMIKQINWMKNAPRALRFAAYSDFTFHCQN